MQETNKGQKGSGQIAATPNTQPAGAVGQPCGAVYFGTIKRLKANSEALELLRLPSTTIEVHVRGGTGSIYCHGEVREETLVTVRQPGNVAYFGTNGSAHFRRVSKQYAEGFLGCAKLEERLNPYKKIDSVVAGVTPGAFC